MNIWIKWTQTDPRCLVYVSSKSMARTSTQNRESLVLRLEPRLRSRFWSIILELIRSHIGHQLHCCRFLVSIYQTARRWGFQRPIWRKGRIARRLMPPIHSFTLQSPGHNSIGCLSVCPQIHHCQAEGRWNPGDWRRRHRLLHRHLLCLSPCQWNLSPSGSRSGSFNSNESCTSLANMGISSSSFLRWQW